MKNPFVRNKKTHKPIIVHRTLPSSGPNTLSGNVNSLPSSLSPISITGVCGMQGVQGVTGPIGPIGVSGSIGSFGSTAWGWSSAVTYSQEDPEEIMRRRKKQLMDEFERSPELFSEIIVELRKRKIKQIKENAKNVNNATT